MTECLRPKDAKEVAEAVEWALAREKTLEIAGHGTKQSLGRAAQWDLTLDLSALSGVTLYEPEELVLSAKAGTPLTEIDAMIAAKGQQLDFEPMDCGPILGRPVARGTLGGALAANLCGPRRIKTGAARDHFLGVSAVSGRGETFKSGGRVVKNVTGYDLCKLLAGSWGTLAAMTEVTIKLLPRPETEETLVSARRRSSLRGSTRSRAGRSHETVWKPDRDRRVCVAHAVAGDPRRDPVFGRGRCRHEAALAHFDGPHEGRRNRRADRRANRSRDAI